MLKNIDKTSKNNYDIVMLITQVNWVSMKRGDAEQAAIMRGLCRLVENETNHYFYKIKDYDMHHIIDLALKVDRGEIKP